MRRGAACRSRSASSCFILAARVYLGRFDRLFEDHTIFAGVTYTDAHVTLTGLLIVSIALAAGGLAALLNAVSAPRVRWLIASVVPAAVLLRRSSACSAHTSITSSSSRISSSKSSPTSRTTSR